MRRQFGTHTSKDMSWNKTGVNLYGVPWPPDCSLDSLEFAEAWKPDPQDVFIATYPKSGTTWVLHLVHQLASKGNMNYNLFTEVHPFWEATPGIHVSLTNSPTPRVIKTHAPLSVLPTIHDMGVKHICVLRDPRDVVVSYYEHSLLSRHLDFDLTFDSFFQKFIQGKVFFGSWFDHALDVIQYKNQPNVLFLLYEDMIEDLESVIAKIIKFTGFHVTEEQMQLILPRLSFQFMKQHDAKFDFTLQYSTRDKSKNFFRKGQKGDHSNYFQSHHRKILEQKYNDTIGNALPYKMSLEMF
jgi:hypothetical protein